MLGCCSTVSVLSQSILTNPPLCRSWPNYFGHRSETNNDLASSSTKDIDESCWEFLHTFGERAGTSRKCL